MSQKLCTWRSLQRSLIMTFRIYYYYTKSIPPKRRVRLMRQRMSALRGFEQSDGREFNNRETLCSVCSTSRATPAIGVARERRVWRATPWISPSIRSVHSTWPDDKMICPTEGLKNAQWTEGMIAFLVQILSSRKSCFGICCKCDRTDC